MRNSDWTQIYWNNGKPYVRNSIIEENKDQ